MICVDTCAGAGVDVNLIQVGEYRVFSFKISVYGYVLKFKFILKIQYIEHKKPPCLNKMEDCVK